MAEPLRTTDALKRTPLYGLHVRLGGRMVPFAGYELPVQYPSGIMKEHLHTRSAASLFDVSHMGQIMVRARSGRLADAALALETLAPGDIAGLPVGRQRYTVLTNAEGGILDDLMVANHGCYLMLIVNAARKEFDEAHLRALLSDSCEITPQPDRALIALQGPLAEKALAPFVPEVRAMKFMDVHIATLLGTPCFISRSGYTGEDGFEISIPAMGAELLCDALLMDPAVAPAGLGARDSLRLEAGLCLYGSDLDETTTPVEAALEWAIPKVRRPGGARAGGFPGVDIILEQLEHDGSHRRVGLQTEGRALVRAGAPLFLHEHDTEAVGAITSGSYGVSLDAPVAMGYVPPQAAAPGTQVFTEVRGKRLAMTVVTLPFVPARYKR